MKIIQDKIHELIENVSKAYDDNEIVTWHRKETIINELISIRIMVEKNEKALDDIEKVLKRING